MTAFDTDIRVPLVVVGPSVPAGQTTTRIAENVDLRPTFDGIAGAAVPRVVDGHSLLPVLDGTPPRGWRSGALIEHHGPDHATGDPDLPRPGSGNPASYEALRTSDAVYVEYRNGQREYYALRTDPNELHNRYNRLSRRERSKLHHQLEQLHRCRGPSC
jgi:arylsulfatase A-like enzyme